MKLLALFIHDAYLQQTHEVRMTTAQHYEDGTTLIQNGLYVSTINGLYVSTTKNRPCHAGGVRYKYPMSARRRLLPLSYYLLLKSKTLEVSFLAMRFNFDT